MGHYRRDEHEPRHPVPLTLRAASSVPSLTVDCSLSPPCGIQSPAEATQDFAFWILSVEQDRRARDRRGRHPRRPDERHSKPRHPHRAGGQARGRRRSGVGRSRPRTRAPTTPREVRHAIAYVLLNFRKHLRAPAGIDPLAPDLGFRRLEATFTAACRRSLPDLSRPGPGSQSPVGGAAVSIQFDDGPKSPRGR